NWKTRLEEQREPIEVSAANNRSRQGETQGTFPRGGENCPPGWAVQVGEVELHSKVQQRPGWMRRASASSVAR
ncbi:hypothetical protein K0M31_019046, partial [Melipona bicolor]